MLANTTIKVSDPIDQTPLINDEGTALQIELNEISLNIFNSVYQVSNHVVNFDGDNTAIQASIENSLLLNR